MARPADDGGAVPRRTPGEIGQGLEQGVGETRGCGGLVGEERPERRRLGRDVLEEELLAEGEEAQDCVLQVSAAEKRELFEQEQEVLRLALEVGFQQPADGGIRQGEGLLDRIEPERVLQAGQGVRDGFRSRALVQERVEARAVEAEAGCDPAQAVEQAGRLGAEADVGVEEALQRRKLLPGDEQLGVVLLAAQLLDLEGERGMADLAEPVSAQEAARHRAAEGDAFFFQEPAEDRGGGSGAVAR
jgi:hypothetical protein